MYTEKGTPQLQRPRAVVATAERLYVAEAEVCRISVFQRSNGRFISHFGLNTLDRPSVVEEKKGNSWSRTNENAGGSTTKAQDSLPSSASAFSSPLPCFPSAISSQASAFSSPLPSFPSAISSQANASSLAQLDCPCLALRPHTSQLWVGCGNTNQVLVFSLLTNSLVRTFPNARRPAPDAKTPGPDSLTAQEHLLTAPDAKKSVADHGDGDETARTRPNAHAIVLNAATGFVSLDGPRNLVFNASGSVLYIAECHANRVSVWDAESGSCLGCLGEKGDRPGQLRWPWGLCLPQVKVKPLSATATSLWSISTTAITTEHQGVLRTAMRSSYFLTTAYLQWRYLFSRGRPNHHPQRLLGRNCVWHIATDLHRGELRFTHPVSLSCLLVRNTGRPAADARQTERTDSQMILHQLASREPFLCVGMACVVWLLVQLWKVMREIC
eukprot:g11565.t1